MFHVRVKSIEATTVRVLAVDVNRAYVYAPARPEIYIEIPMEDWQPGDETRVAKFNLSFHGTRDAAQNWTKEYTKQITKLGFATVVATPCNFVNEAQELFVTVNGDDFTVVGPEASLQWFKASLEGIYEIKAEFLGLQEEGCQTEVRILNRTIRWTAAGLEYESDHRHADLII